MTSSPQCYADLSDRARYCSYCRPIPLERSWRGFLLMTGWLEGKSFPSRALSLTMLLVLGTDVVRADGSSHQRR